MQIGSPVILKTDNGKMNLHWHALICILNIDALIYIEKRLPPELIVLEIWSVESTPHTSDVLQ